MNKPIANDLIKELKLGIIENNKDVLERWGDTIYTKNKLLIIVNKIEHQIIARMQENNNELLVHINTRLTYKPNVKNYMKFLEKHHNHCNDDCQNKWHWKYESHKEFIEVYPELNKYYQPEKETKDE